VRTDQLVLGALFCAGASLPRTIFLSSTFASTASGTAVERREMGRAILEVSQNLFPFHIQFNVKQVFGGDGIFLGRWGVARDALSLVLGTAWHARELLFFPCVWRPVQMQRTIPHCSFPVLLA
jgi:hypothetical protein